MALILRFLQNLQISFYNENDGTTATLVIFFAIFAILWYKPMFTKSQKTSPPGPRGLPITGNLSSLDRKLQTYFTSLARTYGPVLKIKLGNKIGIVVSSLSSARVENVEKGIYAENALQHYLRLSLRGSTVVSSRNSWLCIQSSRITHYYWSAHVFNLKCDPPRVMISSDRISVQPSQSTEVKESAESTDESEAKSALV